MAIFIIDDLKKQIRAKYAELASITSCCIKHPEKYLSIKPFLLFYFGSNFVFSHKKRLFHRLGTVENTLESFCPPYISGVDPDFVSFCQPSLPAAKCLHVSAFWGHFLFWFRPLSSSDSCLQETGWRLFRKTGVLLSLSFILIPCS